MLVKDLVPIDDGFPIKIRLIYGEPIKSFKRVSIDITEALSLAWYAIEVACNGQDPQINQRRTLVELGLSLIIESKAVTSGAEAVVIEEWKLDTLRDVRKKFIEEKENR